MRKRIQLAVLLLTMISLCLHSVCAVAASVPDPEQKGTISFTMLDGSTPVAGGNIILYRVGDISADDGNYSFVLTDAFQQSGIFLDEIQSPETAAALAEFAQNAQITGEEKLVQSDGTVEFTQLVPGLYLAVQTVPADGYYTVAPFLVSLPMYDGEGYLYEIDATPKLELKNAPAEPSDPTNPSTPTEPSEPTEPSDPTVPSEPTEPSDPTVPSEPTEPSDPTLPSESTGPSEPTDPSVPTGPSESTEPSDPTQPSVPSGATDSTAPTETNPTSPTQPTPTTPKPTLPQTGQTNWPIPVLAAAGLVLIVLGWLLRCGERRDTDA